MPPSTTTKARSKTKVRSARAHQQAIVDITEVILEHASVDDLVPRLIETVQRVMQVDNVAILRLDPTGQALVMDTVRGPEEAVADRVRVPVGQGVAGRIAATGKPLFIPDLSKAEVVNSFLSEHLTTLLGVPLRVADRTVGVIHVSTARQRHFSESDVQLLQLVADRIALALDRVRMLEQAKQARDLAEERAGQLEAVFASMTDGVFVMDAAGRVLQSNAAAARLLHFIEPLDYYQRPLQERRLRTVVMDRNGNPMPEQEWPFARILRGEIFSDSQTVDIQLGLHTGDTVVVNVAGAPVRDASGRIVAAVCICREVTERRALEVQKQQTLDAVLTMASMLVQREAPAEDIAHQLIELACDILSCERASLSIVDPESGLITPFAVAGLAPEKEEQWWAEQRANIMSLADVPDQEFVVAMQSGTVKTYDFTVPPNNALPNPYGILTVLLVPVLVNEQFIGYLALDHGNEYHYYSPAEQRLASAVAQLAGLIIERERLLRERMISQAHALALQETMNRMQRFLGMTSHELRTPLTAIKANVELAARAARRALATGDLSEQVGNQMQRAVGLLESVDRQADHMNRFIADLLDTTRIQAGKLEMHMTAHDVVALVRDVVRIHQGNWPNRKIYLDTPDSPCTILCDPERISQVLTNLITNAVKYTPEEGPIGIQVRHEHDRPDRVRVAVIDQGPGLSTAQQEYLFDAFVQAEGVKQYDETKAGNKGLGLGLFICHGIVTQHGGEIGVESAVGSGSTFWFTLPVDPEGDSHESIDNISSRSSSAKLG